MRNLGFQWIKQNVRVCLALRGDSMRREGSPARLHHVGSRVLPSWPLRGEDGLLPEGREE